MHVLGQIGFVIFLVLLAWVSWIIPRRLGIPGILIAHVVVLLAFFGFEMCAVSITDQYEGGLQAVGSLIVPILFNCLLLPITIGAALFRSATRRRPPRNATSASDQTEVVRVVGDLDHLEA